MKGFTTIEFATVCAILAILAALALPSFAKMLAAQRGIATVNALVGSLQAARQMSISHGVSAVVCARTDDGRCGGDWHAGWVAFEAPSDWSVADPVPTEGVVHVAQPARGVSLRANRDAFRFRSRGRATNGTVIVCSGVVRAVVVSMTGRVRSGGAHDATC